jgi:hypothetical protein
MHCPSGLFVREAVGEPLSGWTYVSVFVGEIGKVGFVESTKRTGIGRVRLGDDDGYASLFGGNDLFAFVLALVGDGLDCLARHDFFRCVRHHRQGFAVIAEVRHFVRDD